MTAVKSIRAKTPPAGTDLYARDFYAWTQEQARLLREQRFGDLDLENLAEEVESVRGSERREIESRLEVLLAHPLKWKYQPGLRSGGSRGTLEEQRNRLARVLRASPSLRAYPGEVFADCHLSARLTAARGTGIDVTLFSGDASVLHRAVVRPVVSAEGTRLRRSDLGRP